MTPINVVISSLTFLHKDGISEQRLLYLLFLLDWEAARKFNRTLTGEQWFLRNAFSFPELSRRPHEYVRECHLLTLSPREGQQYLFRFNGRPEQIPRQTEEVQQLISQLFLKTEDRLTTELAADVKLSYPKATVKHIGEIDLVALAVQEVTDQMDVFQYLESDSDQEPTELDRQWIAWAKKRIVTLEGEAKKLRAALEKTR